eukprot:3431602-Alexandrium_andersonii.AAC.1
MWLSEGHPLAQTPSLTWIGGTPPARGRSHAPWEGKCGSTRALHNSPSRTRSRGQRLFVRFRD